MHIAKRACLEWVIGISRATMATFCIGVAGIWLIAAGLMGYGLVGNVWNDYVIGGAVAILALPMLDDRARVNRIVSTVVALWLIASAFIPALLTGSAARWNDYIAGMILAIAAFRPRQNRQATLLCACGGRHELMPGAADGEVQFFDLRRRKVKGRRTSRHLEINCRRPREIDSGTSYIFVCSNDSRMHAGLFRCWSTWSLMCMNIQ